MTPIVKHAFDLAEDIHTLKEEVGRTTLETNLMNTIKDQLNIAARILIQVEQELLKVPA